MQKTSQSADNYLKALPDEDRADMQQLDTAISKALPGAKRAVWTGKLWGGTEQTIIGYGSYRYQRADKTAAGWFTVGLARQKNYLSVYINAIEDGQYVAKKYAEKLGKVKIGSSSISFKRLGDVNLSELVKLVQIAGAQSRG